MLERRRITEFLFRRKTIGGKSRRFCLATFIQERRMGEWVDIAWDDYDIPRDLSTYRGETAPEPDPVTYPIESQDWGEEHVAKGPFSLHREVPARMCTFAIWTMDGSNHPGFARVYGKGNAQRAADTLNACSEMIDPIKEVQALKARPSTVLEALQGLRAEEVAAALLSLSETRDGFAYDVGMALYEAGAGKDMPGPPFGWYPTGDQTYWLEFVSYDPARRMDALRGLRKIVKLSPGDAKSTLDTLDKGQGFSTACTTWFSAGDVAELHACGFDVQLASSGEAPPASHRVSLHDMFRGPIG